MLSNITDALNRARVTCSALTQAFIDAYSVGKTKEADKYSIDAIVVRSQIKAIEFYLLDTTNTLFTENKLNDIISIVNEFSYANMIEISDYISTVGVDENALGNSNSVVVLKSGSIEQQPRSYSFGVVSNGQTAFTMPFNVSTVDVDSISLVLNSWLNPILNTDYTLTGNTLNWISEVPLSIGYSFEIKYSA
jgi:hypothetical protein